MLQISPQAMLQDVAVTLPASTTPSEAQAIVDALNAQNARVFKVTIVSTVVVGIAAILNSYRLARQLKRDNVVMRALARR